MTFDDLRPSDFKRDDGDDDLEPIDPDFAVITDWLTHDLSPADAKAVEDRLVEDGAFFDKVAPAIRVWTMPVSFRDTLPRRDIIWAGDNWTAERVREEVIRAVQTLAAVVREVDDKHYPSL